MKYYFVYIVECSDMSLYIGLTNNLERRINEHNNGLNDNSYTSIRRPVKLIFHQEFMQFEQAERFEKKLKKWSRKKKLALANGQFDLLKLLSECKNDSHSKNFLPLDSARDDRA
ncbi:GIY-YIG nuclease family protein [Aquimarina sp. AD10]|uniref:GIY-YIG nuclease family protein n=1 Tax=Aquimarina sp. AD10 TaxID=1714849 RepID=UPI000E4898A2|nr:GIY-YIG nuclease family protein [Aquimarina sp. AD10]AXT61686.1 GIY-YIG nuclease family protein [Aquimarina sp. AD10]RKN00965.1 GIY-YIG nuclease family protein [Aquimarina sp. AD10]